MFDKNLIFLNKNFKNSDDIFEFAFNELYSRNYVKESFLDAIKKREKEYPTGLEAEDINFAIPHTDSIHVNKAKIVYITLREPVIFKYMPDSDKNLEVKIIFILVVKDKEKQVPLLMKLMEKIPQEGFLKELLSINNEIDVFNKLNTIFN